MQTFKQQFFEKLTELIRDYEYVTDTQVSLNLTFDVDGRLNDFMWDGTSIFNTTEYLEKLEEHHE